MKELTDLDAPAFLSANKDRLVLLYFTAKWCGPCKQMTPIVEEIDLDIAYRSDTLGSVYFAKVDIDAAPMLAQNFEVRSVPMLVMSHKGQLPPYVLHGAHTKSKIFRWITDCVVNAAKKGQK